MREQGLIEAIDQHDALAIAVSGGVDSMVLAYVAHARARTQAVIVHAQSPAVPALATQRVRAHAARHGWTLRVIDAGEFDDPQYRANPINRCYFCKSNLYGRIREVTGLTIASGTNVDDLDDFRPGLIAARERDVVHPFVQAGFSKPAIYALARAYGLTDLAALPAQPCLSSRIETGIAVDPADLRFIDAVEQQLAAALPAATALRCRVTSAGVFVECAPLPEDAAAIGALVSALCAEAGRHFAGLRDYRRGSAFAH